MRSYGERLNKLLLNVKIGFDSASPMIYSTVKWKRWYENVDILFSLRRENTIAPRKGPVHYIDGVDHFAKFKAIKYAAGGSQICLPLHA